MALEIERKFLIAHIPPDIESWQEIQQAYLQADPERSVRVRITSGPNRSPVAHIAIKGPAEPGHFSRHEFEYEIPVQDAQIIMPFCDHPPVQKKRHYYTYANRRWELDEFMGANAGLLIAEIELASETDAIALPPFVQQEVTGDPRYFNLSLAYHPFSMW
ncbi:MAG: CYTH domain-containing protein [Kiritimatiellia bacterium]